MQNKLDHIQVLRSIAVIAVVLFHSQIPLFSFGHLGVDMFFVISGYVVTRSYISRFNGFNLESVIDFYKRRLKRLMPAFLVVTSVCLITSFYVQPEYIFKENLLDSIFALFYTSNFRFMFSIDYFSIDALSRLFLHYWSLSIEEQFYLIFPFIFALCVNRMWLLVFIIAISALLFSLLDENLAFYLTFSRIFGLLTGVLLAFSEFKRTKTYILPNVCLFLFGVFLIYKGESGINLIIVPFTVCLILFGKFWYFKKLGWLEKIGDQSYSLYLVHWPIFVFLNVLTEAGTLQLTLYFFLSILFSLILYNVVEVPLNKRNTSIKKLLLMYGFITVLPVIGYFLILQSELKVHKGVLSVQEWKMNLKDLMRETWVYAKESSDVPLDDVEIAILGDSNGKDIFNSMFLTNEKLRGKLRYFSISHKCGISFHSEGSKLSEKDRKSCSDSLNSRLEQIISSPAKTIHITPYWNKQELKDAGEILSFLSKSDKEIVLYGPPVFYGDEVVNLLPAGPTDFSVNLDSFLHKKVKAKNIKVEALAKLYGTKFINRWEVFCKESCPIFDENGNLLKADKFHLTISGAKYFGSQIIKIE
jgi:peptidoglycan/LPS O-acetylase OafA/YrhL